MNNTISEQSRCIAHEIRNHISICELYTRIIEKNLENEGVENDSVNNALKCITKSLKIMNNSLLDLKSLNNLSINKYDIKDLLEESINLSQVYIGEKDIKINFSANKSAYVFVDENKFLACVVNIIKNAIEAIKIKGEINIKLNINEKVSIKISNNGESIKNPDDIFQAGYTTKKTGNGLGLHICSNNLKAQNAELRLSVATEKLTEFEITLPTI